MSYPFHSACLPTVKFHVLFLFLRNLQAAIGSYYDFEQPSSGPVAPILSMTLVKDITIGDGESVRPGVNFTKTWRIKNTGNP